MSEEEGRSPPARIGKDGTLIIPEGRRGPGFDEKFEDAIKEAQKGKGVVIEGLDKTVTIKRKGT